MFKLPIPQQQSGAVLVVSLIMLLLLTIIGVTSMQTTSLEEKMAGNMRDKNLAFQAAETALKTAEASLPPAASIQFNGTDGYYSSTATPAVTDNDFWEDYSNNHSSGISLPNISQPPRYIIQDLGCISPALTPCPGQHVYRITAYAYGGSTNAVVILQSIYQI
ncbi:hypothetical protein A1359_19770 [Methylomonas lenta]|uniref:Pilus assembly protein PilX n=1 Tax=Methylomonas lenta TaxID=980561 RepID=A0A177NVP1_9GAMM|nr:PilX N-terminal domain-containing pilus assembly protein [Methylomonas lenta]OAI21160.1 hypothetical protein A1359_19770 [Methylomonas lenta]